MAISDKWYYSIGCTIAIATSLFISYKIDNINCDTLIRHIRVFEDYDKFDFTTGKVVDSYEDNGSIYIHYQYIIDNIKYTNNDIIDPDTVTAGDDVLVFYSLSDKNESITNNSTTFSKIKMGLKFAAVIVIMILSTFILVMFNPLLSYGYL